MFCCYREPLAGLLCFPPFRCHWPPLACLSRKCQKIPFILKWHKINVDFYLFITLAVEAKRLQAKWIAFQFPDGKCKAPFAPPPQNTESKLIWGTFVSTSTFYFYFFWCNYYLLSTGMMDNYQAPPMKHLDKVHNAGLSPFCLNITTFLKSSGGQLGLSVKYIMWWTL